MSSAPDFQTERCSQLLARELGDGFGVLTRRVGPGGKDRNLPAAFMWLSRFEREFDVIHVWDEKYLGPVLGSRQRILFSPSQALSMQGSRLLWLLLQMSNVQVVCTNEWQRRAMLRTRVPSERMHTLFPPVDGAGMRQGNAAIRSTLGLLDTDRVLLAPGESTQAAGHRDALWTASILRVLDPRWQLLIWGRGNEAQTLRRLAGKFAQSRLLCVAERELKHAATFEELAAAADVALFTPRQPPQVLPLLTCMAAGLPIVSSARGAQVGFFSGNAAAVVPDNRPKLLATRLLALAEDSSARQAHSQEALKAAAPFTTSRFVEDYRELYRQICDQ